jgi:hypothetical protein
MHQFTPPLKRKHSTPYPGHSMLGRQGSEVIDLTEEPPNQRAKRRQLVPNVVSRNTPTYVNVAHQPDGFTDFTNPHPGRYPLGNQPISLPRTPSGHIVVEQLVPGHSGWPEQAQQLGARQIQTPQPLALLHSPSDDTIVQQQMSGWQGQAQHMRGRPIRTARPTALSRTPSGQTEQTLANSVAWQRQAQNLGVTPIPASRPIAVSCAPSGQTEEALVNSAVWQGQAQNPGTRPIQTPQALPGNLARIHDAQYRALVESRVTAVLQQQSFQQSQLGGRQESMPTPVRQAMMQSKQILDEQPQLLSGFSFDGPSIPTPEQQQARPRSQQTSRAVPQNYTRGTQELRHRSSHTNAVAHSPTSVSIQPARRAYFQYHNPHNTDPPITVQPVHRSPTAPLPNTPVYPDMEEAEDDCIKIDIPAASIQEPERDMTWDEMGSVLDDWAMRIDNVDGTQTEDQKIEDAWGWLKDL